MSYEVKISQNAKASLRALEKEDSLRILAKIESARHLPHHFLERLSGSDLWKLRVGDYRVFVDLIEEKKEMWVLDLGHRKNIYKK